MITKLTGYLMLFVALARFYCGSALDSRQNPAAVAVQARQQNNKLKLWETCGSVEIVAHRVEVCAKPLTDILQGTLEKWPRKDNDIIDLCNMFQESEKCIRDTARRCAKGLERVIISTFANSFQRVRKRECIKKNYPELLRATMCIEAHQDVPQLMIANVTSRLSVIELQIKDPDKKTQAICCMVTEIESETRRLMGPVCPIQVSTVINLYRSVLEDVIQLLCTSPKCGDLFRGYKVPPIKMNSDLQGIISSLLKIVFSLSESSL